MGKLYKDGWPNPEEIKKLREAVKQADEARKARKSADPEAPQFTARVPGDTFATSSPGLAQGNYRAGARSTGDKTEKSR